MPKIMPITVLRNTTEISETCHKLNEPIFITKNGYGDMVIMSLETYEKEFVLTDIYRKLAVAEKQIADGKEIDAKEALEKLRAKYGF